MTGPSQPAQAFLPDADGWVPAARRVPSPNFDQRPPGMPVDLVVLHNISLPPGQFGSGDIEVNTGLDRPVVLRDAPNADLVQGALHDLMEASLNPIAARRQAEASRPSDETTAWGTR